MSRYTLSFFSTSHDGSTSIFKDDQLIFFLHSERFSRNKGAVGIGPKLIQYISENITNEIDLLYNFSPIALTNILSKNGFNVKESVNPLLNREHFDLMTVDSQFTHHNSHAYSAFYLSPFKEAVCLVIDGYGNNFKVLNNDGLGIYGTETTSIIEIKKNYDLKTLYKRLKTYPASTDKNFDIYGGLKELSLNKTTENCNGIFNELPYKVHASYSPDIGFMYDVITEHLGFHSHSGAAGFGGFGKTMGLSAYGNSNNNLPDFLIENTIESNNNLFTPARELNFSLYPELFDKNNLNFQTKADLAYECQKSLEKIFLHHAKFIKENSKIKNLIICGGCCLNILGVSKIKEMFPEFNIFVDPIGTDATHSIGKGIYAYKKYINNDVVKRNNFNSIYLGSEYKEDQIINEINDWMKQYETP